VLARSEAAMPEMIRGTFVSEGTSNRAHSRVRDFPTTRSIAAQTSSEIYCVTSDRFCFLTSQQGMSKTPIGQADFARCSETSLDGLRGF